MSTTRANGRIQTTSSALAAVRAQARLALPGECCGALLGRALAAGATIERVLPLPNQADGTATYLLGPDSVQRAEAEAAAAGLEVVGFYHSHPASPPVPTPADLAAGWPWYTYLLVDASTGEARAWTLAEDRSAFVERIIFVGDRL